MSGHGSGNCHLWADEMGAATTTLPALKISVRGGGTALTLIQLVGIHRKTHRTARLTPVKASITENPVKAFCFRLFLD
jgi:hypothetical protein